MKNTHKLILVVIILALVIPAMEAVAIHNALNKKTPKTFLMNTFKDTTFYSHVPPPYKFLKLTSNFDSLDFNITRADTSLIYAVGDYIKDKKFTLQTRLVGDTLIVDMHKDAGTWAKNYHPVKINIVCPQLFGRKQIMETYI